MTLPGFETWKGIYDENLSKVWKNESNELRTVTVLFHALQAELKKIENQVNNEVSQLRKKISQRDRLSEELKTIQLDDSPKSFTFPSGSSGSSSSRNSSKKTTPVIFKKLKTKHEITSNQTKNDSPDLFRNDHNNSSCDESDVVLVDETLIQTSPTLNRRTKPFVHKIMQQKKESVTKNIFSTPKRSKINNENIPACTNVDDPYDLDLTYVEGWSQRDECNADKVEVIEQKLFKEPKTIMRPDPQPEPVIRGKARKFMNAASCKDCEQFYNGLNLPFEKRQQLIKNCSKHRYVHQLREETPPGFWNMSFPDI